MGLRITFLTTGPGAKGILTVFSLCVARRLKLRQHNPHPLKPTMVYLPAVKPTVVLWKRDRRGGKHGEFRPTIFTLFARFLKVKMRVGNGNLARGV